MRKIVSYLHTSLDGFVQGAQAWDLNWISYDAALEAYARDILSTVDTVLWGRTTYLGMQHYWPTVPANPESSQHERDHAAWLERTEKIIFSKTLENISWNNSDKIRLVKDDIAQEVSRLKQQPGGDMIILGSPGLTHSLTELDLVDEYKININPIVIGGGIPLFKDANKQMKLNLVASKTFASGVVGLHYEVKHSE